MSSSRLDQIVKGAPTTPQPAAIPSSGVQSSDPTLHLPSSPPQIYLNLLILEASLRSQFLELRARRRQHTFFLFLLAAWVSYFAYALFLAPREDGSGVGGSVYWVVEVGEKVALGAGIVTALLVWGTGQWERGVRWPRRWVGVTNRGLRGFNLKIVVVKQVWWKEWLSFIKFFIAGGLLHNNGSSSYRFIPPALQSDRNGHGPVIGHRSTRSQHLPNIAEHPQGTEEDLSPGGDTIALLLLPKPFSPAFREDWDIYRTEYWEKENARRKVLLAKLKAYEKAQRRKVAWWKRMFWPGSVRKAEDVEKSGTGLRHNHSRTQSKVGHLSVHDKEKRLRSGSIRSGSHSRTSSRSSTPAGRDEMDNTTAESRGHSRRSSTASTRSSVSGREGTRRAGSGLTPTGSLREPGTGVSGRTPGGSFAAALERRPITPNSDNDSVIGGGLAKRRSLLGDRTGNRKRESFVSDTSTEDLRDEVRKDQESSVADRVKENARETAKEVVESVEKDTVEEKDVKP